MSDIQPALTPEEWARYLEGRDGSCGFWKFGSHHEAAALYLYGQPFGFSHEDVKLLRLIHVSRPEMQHRLQFIADRIEALLPPESTA